MMINEIPKIRKVERFGDSRDRQIDSLLVAVRLFTKVNDEDEAAMGSCLVCRKTQIKFH